MKTKKICPGFKKGKNGYCENWTAEKKWRSCRSDCLLKEALKGGYINE